MKNLLVCWLALCFMPTAHCQTPDNLANAEYFWDTDPGFGKGAALALNGTEVNTTLNVPTGTLTQGVHFLGIRLKTARGTWSPTQTQAVYIHAPNPTGDPNNLTAVEFFIDNDLGFGKNTVQKITAKGPEAAVSVDLTIPPTLAVGTHLLGLRIQTERGQWSATQLSPFVVFSSQSTNAISRIEVFIDTDPGYGAANSLAFTPMGGKEVTVDRPLELNLQRAGKRYLFFRARDTAGRWSALYPVPIDISLVLSVSSPLPTEGIKVYPNPTNGVFVVEFDGMAFQKQGTAIEVVDATGKSILQRPIPSFSGKHSENIDISQQAAGVYFLRVVEAEKVSTQKIVKGN
ncbi:T9SS type A sorting domain-containing protein [Runella slithyformis]|uniref:Secretion system C-terminal sorting domain-containing protein n=1 Tax=Runella slithyformis (strain ATCC 29530 / DSM 19594 / LMG 11500 / NCIMB 11436 / LSU 4) TaxID=761193 RepID=A0A7U4E5U0_RUNSL|nr:T9SS type A sorting domain-containing protein [Runella slithyformis]AEI48669.1 hypothetical protein Runsl_2257 [Runella slithyformis DSM 19594]